MQAPVPPKITERFQEFCRSAPHELRPPFPREILVEVANICNHACHFCAYRLMTRAKAVMSFDRFTRILEQAFESGAREAGLYAGAEPFSVKNLHQYVAAAKEIGYEYVYCTSNGSIPTHDRLKQVIDAGLDSLKFSVNGGDRETYHRVHGQDHFDRVIDNIRFVADYRKGLGRPLRLYASFVQTPVNAASFPSMKALLEPIVDEIFHVHAMNVSGQNPDLPTPDFDGPCSQPFKRVTITQEGYLRLCCNDYQNLLAVEDLNLMSVGDAWWSDRMVDMRRRHLEDKLEGTLCFNCMTGKNVRAYPINSALSDNEMVSTLPVVDLETGELPAR